MKQFILLFKGGDDVWDSKSPEEQEVHMQHWMEWIDDMAQKDQYLGGERLYQHGSTILPGGNKVTDRPLTEAKELVGGYIIIKANTMDEAVEMGKGCPGLQWESSVEVREVWPMEEE